MDLEQLAMPQETILFFQIYPDYSPSELYSEK